MEQSILTSEYISEERKQEYLRLIKENIPDIHNITNYHGALIHINFLFKEELHGIAQKDYIFTDKEKELSDVVGEYKYELQKNSTELYDLGKRFHNCVSSYSSSAQNKNCYIICMKKGKEDVACIEIRNYGRTKKVNQFLLLFTER